MAKGYDRLGLYHDADDPRLWVPKSNPMMGWTVNVEHPKGPLVLRALAAVIAAALGYTAVAFLLGR